MRPIHPPPNTANSAPGKTRIGLIFVGAAIAAATLLLRIFYSGHLYQDDGLWFSAGEELLRGKALYRDIYFDKPPVIAFVYAGLFKLFGAHILTIRLFTIAYSIAESAMLYALGNWLYGKRAGMLAAAMFAVFATTFTTGHVQGLNTDLLMTLPYTAAVYWWMRAGGAVGWRRWVCGFLAGVLAGLSSQINPKGAFVLVFFALLPLIRRRPFNKEPMEPRKPRWSFHRLDIPTWSAVLAGVALSLLPFLIYLLSTGAFGFYWRYVWEWGSRYARYYPASHMFGAAFKQTAQYFLLNNTLFVALLFMTDRVIRRSRHALPIDDPSFQAGADGHTSRPLHRADAALLLWFAVSYMAMSIGGRFFGHYFLQIVPALCLIGASALPEILARLLPDARLNPPPNPKPARALRYGLLALLIIGFGGTIVRFHLRTAVLASDWLRGSKSVSTRAWFHERLNNEERMAAARVRNLELEPEEAAAAFGLEAMRPPGRSPGSLGPSDYLFVWGYRPEIYYWSGLLPASKYLSSQALTGVPADIHYFDTQYHSILDERETSLARRELAEELSRVRPEYIIDELGFFNDDLAITRYGELNDVMSGYKNRGTVGRFIIYRRADIIDARKQEKKKMMNVK